MGRSGPFDGGQCLSYNVFILRTPPYILAECLEMAISLWPSCQPLPVNDVIGLSLSETGTLHK